MKSIAQWINTLSKQEMERLEALLRVQLAQVLLEAYLTTKGDRPTTKQKKSTRKRSR
jgi:hypothetical protein